MSLCQRRPMSKQKELTACVWDYFFVSFCLLRVGCFLLKLGTLSSRIYSPEIAPQWTPAFTVTWPAGFRLPPCRLILDEIGGKRSVIPPRVSCSITRLLGWHQWTASVIQRNKLNIFAVQCCASTAYAVMRYPSVRQLRGLCRNKSTDLQIFSPSGSQTILVFPHQISWQYSDGAGRKMQVGLGTSRDSGRLIAAEVRGQQLTVVGAIVYHSYGARLFTAQRPPCIVNTLKRRKQNKLFVRSGKSEAAVTNNRRLRSTYITIKANYWQTRSIARPLCDSMATCRLTAAT